MSSESFSPLLPFVVIFTAFFLTLPLVSPHFPGVFRQCTDNVSQGGSAPKYILEALMLPWLMDLSGICKRRDTRIVQYLLKLFKNC